ncbi:Oidioi.mRNA.OKI2018_I69.chr2.g4696.t1.cds [Oikopleura dioica]|uniref:Oidioi.mRNA.OKI2018_I69.chr2.g4696.t1.cds n=1 Tax=Oikopleura dioica TaxID=34765 RepID=A0ABN7SZQ8_OIKDI|nr:Oidioi.mRNA.OKI2018_I69.chr2.g4696.t1.cds [Oikopleura dioica]
MPKRRISSCPLNGVHYFPKRNQNQEIDILTLESSSQPAAKRLKIQSAMIQCKLCEGFFYDPIQLADHKCSCLVAKKYKCKLCEREFSSAANLASHDRWHRQQKRDKHFEGMAFKNGDIRSTAKEISDKKTKSEKSSKSWITIEVLSNLERINDFF